MFKFHKQSNLTNVTQEGIEFWSSKSSREREI